MLSNEPSGVTVRTRFAPSPTGRLHLGHVLAARVAHDLARGHGGQFLLRHEDIDVSRVREEYFEQIEEDLCWLGLRWDGPALRQSKRLAAYAAALDRLRALGVIYPCACTRREIQDEVAAMVAAPQGPEGPLYPGTCRPRADETLSDRNTGFLPVREDSASRLSADETTGWKPVVHDRQDAYPPARPTVLASATHAWRLDSRKAADLTGRLTFADLRHGTLEVNPDLLGDVVLARRDIGTAYHLAVVVDDAYQQISHVTRGEDLLPATHVQRLLQALLGLPEPVYLHHPLVLDAQGRRLAKRHDALAIAALRQAGMSAAEVLARLD